MTGRAVIGGASVPRLPVGVRLKHDAVRKQWVLLAPERMFVLDEIALEVLRACDGTHSVDAIVDGFASRFGAPRETIFADVNALLQDFADKGVLVA